MPIEKYLETVIGTMFPLLYINHLKQIKNGRGHKIIKLIIIR